MALDKALPEIAIGGAFEAIAAAVQTARDAFANNEITQQELNHIKTIGRLTDNEVDAIIAEAKERRGL